jgi:hypothetical protein
MKYLFFSCIVFSNVAFANIMPLKYISVYGVSKSCDITFTSSSAPKSYIVPEDVKSGDVLWIQSYYVPTFCNDFLPKIENPFVLVINWGDESFPTSHKDAIDIEEFIKNPKILHIFAQNCDYNGPQIDKVSPLPIGIDVHTLITGSGAFGEVQQTPKKQEKVLDKVVNSLKPTYLRKKRALVEFHHHDTIANGWKSINRYLDPGETRVTIAKKIAQSGVIDFLDRRIVRRKYWKLKGEYAFSVCPPGNGLDTLRAWEDLILGCIVIVKTSPMDRLFEGLPVVIIKDWSEINEQNFSKWLEQYGDALENPSYREKLTLTYWMEKIRSKSYSK